MVMGQTCEERNARERMGLFSVNTEAVDEIKAKREERKARAAERKAEKASRHRVNLGDIFVENKYDLVDEFFGEELEKGNGETVKKFCERILEEIEAYEEEQAELEKLPQPCLVFVNMDTGQALRNRDWEKNGQPTGFAPRVRWLFGDYISVFDVPNEVAEAFHTGEYNPDDYADEIADAISRYEALSGDTSSDEPND